MFVRDFLKYLQLERNYSLATITVYEEALRSFASSSAGSDNSADFDWACVRPEMIRSWIVATMDRGLSASTVNKQLSALRSFFRFSLAKGYVESDPTRKVVGPKVSKPIPYFYRESEMDALLDKTNFGTDFNGVRDKMIIQMFYSTGVRLSELISMKLGDVDFSASQIKVTGKRNKQRIIPFGEELYEALSIYIGVRDAAFDVGNDFLFLSPKGKKMTAPYVYNMVKKYLSQVTTLKKKSPHVLRHTFATTMLNHDAKLEVVKELLGHESIATTEVYTHTTFEELKKIYNKAHPRA